MRCWRALITVTTGLLGALDGELQSEHGLSLGEYEVLVHLSEEPEHSLRMTDLAGRLHLSPSGITRRIDGLDLETAFLDHVDADDLVGSELPAKRAGGKADGAETGYEHGVIAVDSNLFQTLVDGSEPAGHLRAVGIRKLIG